ncbi:hypothetical protein SAMN04487869_1015 [Marinobacter sp. DSM 26671]|uniref:hypothetical protein n=1 Tax=Marinobacter sp. DSM 26671 TaxID=1761793 RepID=UPI0008E64C5B|nr:hypothetical protein [Marinobacter sp. DSM 26671]SFD90574.1 hypothetical protein SAMN04487869_1015 [Marinobacter sp. DSM 26671]
MSTNLRSSVFLALIAPSFVCAETLFSIGDLVYEGAARIPVGTYGDSRMGYAEGTFHVTDDFSSAFMVGHSQHQAIAEFALPQFSTASSISELPMAQNKQPFQKFFDRVPSGNPDSINRITGMNLINDELVVNGVQYYDGDANNTDTTFVIENPNELATSPVTGFLKLSARSHASGWMSEIPAKFQDTFKGEYIFGYASNYAINARNSIGPSAFGVAAKTITNASSGDQVPTFPLIDYSIDNPLAQDPYNRERENDLWTEVSTAHVGFIVPGSDTYAVFGTSGGHNSGIGYKITQDNGQQCGGPCPYEASDVYNYFWFYDVNDMISVAQGNKAPHEVRPYEYGEIQLPFQEEGKTPNLVIGASFNHSKNRLFLMLGRADKLQSQYESAPLLLSYSIALGSRPNSPSGLKIQ